MIEAKIEHIRKWLRYHGDYDVQLSLWSLYGTINVSIWHLTERVFASHGITFEKRLDEVIAFLRIGDEGATGATP